MSERDPRLYCEDILESGNAILDFVEGLSFEDFCDDRKTYSAVIREFETFEKCSILFKFKEGENFNHRNTLSILRIKI